MASAVQIVAAAAFTGIASVSLGTLVIQALRVPLHRREVRLLGFVLGSALLSLAVFLSTAMWMARPLWFAAIGAAAIALCLWRRSWRYETDVPLEPLPVLWRWIFAAGMLAYGTLTLAHAMAPEISPDGASYHLGNVARHLREGGFTWHTTSMYSNLPAGVEMLFLFAFAFGKHSAAALVHWQFYVMLPLLLLTFGQRFGQARAGAIAGLLVFLSPVVSLDGSSAYVDIATSAAVFGVFYGLLVWERTKHGGMLIVIGCLAGFCYASKMTAFLAVPFAVGFVVWKHWRAREPWLRPAATIALCAAALIVPWLVKNAVIVGNPFSPFLNRWFPNPYVTVDFEAGYRENLRTYDGAITSAWQIPLEVTTAGATLNGFLGPVFLLAPLALFALRWPLGRRLLLAALIFLLPYPSNIGTRFLLTALPLVALALAMVLSQWKGTGIAVVLFHSFFSWPAVAGLYCHQHAWRITEFDYRAALRIEKEEDFLRRRMLGYDMVLALEKHVPPHGKVFGFSGLPSAYTSREILVGYEAALNQVMADILTIPMAGVLQPLRSWHFQFPSRKVRRIRLVQTETFPELWSIAELRVFRDGTELPRDEGWRVRSNPNPWDVQMAFDNCPITRWRSWEKPRPGMFLEIDFGRDLEVSEVRAEVSPDQRTSARLDAETSSEKWETLVSKPDVRQREPVENARRIATDELKRMGVTHILSHTFDFNAQDLLTERLGWGITIVAESPRARLYRID
jgi:hypothetical protein